MDLRTYGYGCLTAKVFAFPNQPKQLQFCKHALSKRGDLLAQGGRGKGTSQVLQTSQVHHKNQREQSSGQGQETSHSGAFFLHLMTCKAKKASGGDPNRVYHQACGIADLKPIDVPSVFLLYLSTNALNMTNEMPRKKKQISNAPYIGGSPGLMNQPLRTLPHHQ